jgi:hypothetical protein
MLRVSFFVSFERKSFAYVKMIRKNEGRGMDTGDFTLLQVEELVALLSRFTRPMKIAG